MNNGDIDMNYQVIDRFSISVHKIDILYLFYNTLQLNFRIIVHIHTTH